MHSIYFMTKDQYFHFIQSIVCDMIAYPETISLTMELFVLSVDLLNHIRVKLKVSLPN